MKVTITNNWINYGHLVNLEVGRTYNVNELVHHENMYVRREAAARGYGLDVFVSDKELWVRDTVETYLKEHSRYN